MVERLFLYGIDSDRYYLAVSVRNERPVSIDPDSADARLPIGNPAEIRAQITSNRGVVELFIECSFQRTSPPSNHFIDYRNNLLIRYTLHAAIRSVGAFTVTVNAAGAAPDIFFDDNAAPGIRPEPEVTDCRPEEGKYPCAHGSRNMLRGGIAGEHKP